MKRKAFLLGYEGNENPLTAVKFDLNSMKNYLLSPEGGAYNEEEIILLYNESSRKIYQKLSYLEFIDSCDFFLFYWSGHGCQIDEQYNLELEIGPDEYLLTEKIPRIAEKTMYIYDTCRVLIPNPPLEKKSAIILESATESYDEKRRIARCIYDEALYSAHNGPESFYACAKGEEAQADYDNSLFTKCVIDSAFEFTNYPAKSNVASMYEVCKRAREKCISISKGLQHPSCRIPKTPNLFPFAINI